MCSDAPIKDKGFTLYNEDLRFAPEKAKESKPGTVSYKRPIHGSGYHAVNYNMAILARQLHPDLAVIDGYEGMEGNGPTQGTPIDHRVCVDKSGLAGCRQDSGSNLWGLISQKSVI